MSQYDGGNIENGDVNCMNQSGITNFEITSPLLLRNDEEMNESIWSLNVKQRQIFYYVLTWEKERVKQENSTKPKEVKPSNLFISGSG